MLIDFWVTICLCFLLEIVCAFGEAEAENCGRGCADSEVHSSKTATNHRLIVLLN